MRWEDDRDSSRWFPNPGITSSDSRPGYNWWEWKRCGNPSVSLASDTTRNSEQNIYFALCAFSEPVASWEVLLSSLSLSLWFSHFSLFFSLPSSITHTDTFHHTLCVTHTHIQFSCQNRSFTFYFSLFDYLKQRSFFQFPENSEDDELWGKELQKRSSRPKGKSRDREDRCNIFTV